MKLINRHQFANDKSFEVHHLSAADHRLFNLPECDVIGLVRRDVERRQHKMMAMRPDEALILARLLIDAVYQVTEGYATDAPRMTTMEFAEGRPR